LKHSHIQVGDNDETRIAMSAVARLENIARREYCDDLVSIADVRDLYNTGVELPTTQRQAERVKEIRQCIESGMNYAETAIQLGRTRQSVGYIARRYGIVPKKKTKIYPVSTDLTPRALEVQACMTAGMTQYKTSIKLGISKQAVSEMCRKYCIKRGRFW